MKSKAQEIEDPRGTMRTSKINFVDLSGAERDAVDETNQKIVEEATQINKSLFSLSKCISALSNSKNGAYVPYRDSKLTRFLKDSLSGATKTVMICHVSPCYSRFKESIATLKYAELAKLIPVNQKETSKQFKEIQDLEYKRMVVELRKELDHLRVNQGEPSESNQHNNKISEGIVTPSLRSFAQGSEKQPVEQRSPDSDRLNNMSKQLMSLYDEQIDIRKQICDIEAQNKVNQMIMLKKNNLSLSNSPSDDYVSSMLEDLQTNTKSNISHKESLDAEMKQINEKIEVILAEMRSNLGSSEEAKKYYQDIINNKQNMLARLEVETSVRIYEELNSLLLDKVIDLRNKMKTSEPNKQVKTEGEEYRDRNEQIGWKENKRQNSASIKKIKDQEEEREKATKSKSSSKDKIGMLSKQEIKDDKKVRNNNENSNVTEEKKHPVEAIPRPSPSQEEINKSKDEKVKNGLIPEKKQYRSKGEAIDVKNAVLEMQYVEVDNEKDGESDKFGFKMLDESVDEIGYKKKRDQKREEEKTDTFAYSKNITPPDLSSRQEYELDRGRNKNGKIANEDLAKPYRPHDSGNEVKIESTDKPIDDGEEEGELQDDFQKSSERIQRSIQREDIIEYNTGMEELKERYEQKNDSKKSNGRDHEASESSRLSYLEKSRQVEFAEKRLDMKKYRGQSGNEGNEAGSKEQVSKSRHQHIDPNEMSDSETNPVQLRNTRFENKEMMEKTNFQPGSRKKEAERQGMNHEYYDSLDSPYNQNDRGVSKLDDHLYREIMDTCLDMLDDDGVLANNEEIPVEPLENPERVTNIKFGTEANQEVRWNLNVVWGEEYKMYEGTRCDYPESWSMFEAEFMVDEADFLDLLNPKELALLGGLRHKVAEGRPTSRSNSRSQEAHLPNLQKHQLSDSRSRERKEPTRASRNGDIDEFEDDFKSVINLKPSDVIFKSDNVGSMNQDVKLPSLNKNKLSSERDIDRRENNDKSKNIGKSRPVERMSSVKSKGKQMDVELDDSSIR